MGTASAFEGVIGDTLATSQPAFVTRPHPGEDAPNVVVVVLDDLGYAQLGCYGSDISTPTIDSLAAGGVRFANFHVTPLCSPTRAALLTGRNHHSVGMRSISNFNTGFPHMRGHISNNAATIAEVLHEAGYATFAIGKWHLCQMADASAAGPFDQWPLGRGFDRFYGFLDGETDQFSPDLTYDNHRVEPPATPEEGYHLSEDLVDHAIAFIHDSVSVRPDRPFFCYLAFGATHAPHQAPPDYMAKYKGRFDEGWDAARARVFARQLESGLVPPGTALAPRNPGVEAWDDLPENHKRLACRMQEAFAAFLDHTDVQLGRLVNDLEALDLLNNTIICVLADNGASQEGGPFGVMHEMKFFNGILETPDQAIDRIDDIGGPHSHTNYPWGWAQAGNTPFKFYKQNTHEGGVHVPLVVHWPNGARAGVIEHGFAHAIDLAPTIYELAGVTVPNTVKGYDQMPIAGSSFGQALREPNAIGTDRVQYFEMTGHRALYAGGWKAVTRHAPGTPFDDDTWELYDLSTDFSESHDLAVQEPQRLDAMIGLWWQEARRHGVLPLDDRGVELFGASFATRSVHPPSRHYTYYPPVSPLPSQVSAAIGGRSWTMEVAIDRHSGAGGVLWATGTENSGISLFIEGDTLVFDYNAFNDHSLIEARNVVPQGASIVGVRFEREGSGATVALTVDGHEVSTGSIPMVMRVISSVGTSVGCDAGSPVSLRYASPNRFDGTIARLDITVAPSRKEEAAALAAAEQATEMGRQ